MKKKILSLGAVIAICLGVWNYSVNQNNVELSTLALDNVEALASGEGGGYDKNTDCMRCTTSSGYRGSRFYCISGSGGCIITACNTGTC